MDRSAIHRLATSYAPAAVRPATETLLALEAQFAKFVFTASEPILAQMRLAWWRDRFAQSPQDWPVGNALLADLSGWGAQAAELGALVDGWEALLGELPLGPDAFRSYCEGRAAGWLALARTHRLRVDPDGVVAAASRWALADAAAALGDAESAETAREIGRAAPAPGALPKALRPLAVLDTLAARSLRTGTEPLSRPGDLLAVLRRGLIGR